MACASEVAYNEGQNNIKVAKAAFRTWYDIISIPFPEKALDN